MIGLMETLYSRRQSDRHEREQLKMKRLVQARLEGMQQHNGCERPRATSAENGRGTPHDASSCSRCSTAPFP